MLEKYNIIVKWKIGQIKTATVKVVVFVYPRYFMGF